jgi:oxygen-independent coproporphyrinogen-3 oxidase
MDGEIVPRTVEGIVKEIESSSLAGRQAKTIFFGGGTPTFLPAQDLVRLLQTVAGVHPPVPDCEITSEANPGTVDASKFAEMRQGGVNRVSLGAQSFSDSDLIALGRIHRSGEIERAVGAARSAGFDNLNLDLMFALPNQNLRAWEANVDRVLALETDHLSLYCLTLEPGTAFHKEYQRGRLTQPDEESQVAMYDLCCDRLARSGYRQYEISNFAKPGKECRHNLEYWFGNEYAGYGPGAVGCSQRGGKRVRSTNLKHPVRYCEAVESGGPISFDDEVLDAGTLRTERIMLGLRLNEGLAVSEVGDLGPGLGEVVERGWVEFADDRLRLTAAGRHFCSEVTLNLI